MVAKTISYCIIAVLFVTSAHGSEEDLAFFRAKVQPLLSEKCLPCHSHESRTMEGGLTLDSKSGWTTGGDRGPAILPGKPDESLLMTSVRYEDPDLQMPPSDKLSAEEIDVLQQWINKGAIDPREAEVAPELDTDWWSLKELVAIEPPASGHPIDAFIRHRLKREGITPNQRAERARLIRRASIDLHGLQPSPEEVDAFVLDHRPEAFEELIDQLLDSPRYGERWARHWLDVIHFADSHGCEHDVKRPNAWRYRDFVIDRLNADVAWDGFIREQLAPDVFFPEQPQRMAGLGFLAAGPLELSRAGTAPIAFDYLDRDDIVTQTMAAFTSTTANCARCHTHKFDPITQEDYYALQAVFAGIGKGDIEYEPSPTVQRQRREFAALLAAAQTLDPNILLQPEYAHFVKQWVSKRTSQSIRWVELDPDVFLSQGGATLTKQDDGSVFASGLVPDEEHYTVTSELDLRRLTAIRLEVLHDERLPMGGPGRAANGNLHLSEVAFHWFPKGTTSSIKLNVRKATADFDQDGWTSAQAIDGDTQSGWAIFPRVADSHQIVFEIDAPVDTSGGGKLAIRLSQLYPPKHVIGRFRLSVTDADGESTRVLPTIVSEGLSKPSSERTEEQSIAIAAAALGQFAEEQLSNLPAKEVVYGVSSSWSHAKPLPKPQAPKVVHLLRRGAFDKPVREVGPGALSVLEHHPARFEVASQDEAQRRATLAEWLAHRDNVLTWRSVVNRVWHYHFGRGLSDTPNDFGRMGSQPTHPELLDWLAVWFRDEAKGSLKELHRLILTSETWQQSTISSDDASQHALIDRDNTLLWRMNRQRVDADVFRDSILRISGRLDLSMHGPGIEQFVKTKGPQATPALNYTTFDWESEGAKRRSIYRVVWRGIPDPFMEALDFPDLGLLAPKRGFSVSALQSLALLNNDFVLHASDWIADRIADEREELDQQVARAVELIWLRDITEAEQRSFVAFAQKHGLAALCRLMLNSNEFLFVD